MKNTDNDSKPLLLIILGIILVVAVVLAVSFGMSALTIIALNTIAGHQMIPLTFEAAVAITWLVIFVNMVFKFTVKLQKDND